MREMFRSATSFNQDPGSWDIVRVEDVSGMFFSASSFNQNIGNWQLAKVINR